MCEGCCSDYWRTACMLRLKSASFTPHLSPSSAIYISRGTGEHRPSKGQSGRGMAHPCIPEGPTDIFWLFGNIDTPHVNKSSISLLPRSSSGIHQTETTLNTAPILVHRDMKRQKWEPFFPTGPHHRLSYNHVP